MLTSVEHEKSYKNPRPAQSLYVYVYAQSDLSFQIFEGLTSRLGYINIDTNPIFVVGFIGF